MSDTPALEIDAARRIFEDVIAKRTFEPKFSLEIKVRPGAVLEATAIHCKWRLAENGPYSRDITVRITAGAMNLFCQADARTRDEMLECFIRVIRIRLIEGGYNEQDPSSSPFIVHIDEHSLEP